MLEDILGGDFGSNCGVKNVNMILALFPTVEDLWIFKNVKTKNVYLVKFYKWKYQSWLYWRAHPSRQGSGHSL
jgi:hypothetical protein